MHGGRREGAQETGGSGFRRACHRSFTRGKKRGRDARDRLSPPVPSRLLPPLPRRAIKVAVRGPTNRTSGFPRASATEFRNNASTYLRSSRHCVRRSVRYVTGVLPRPGNTHTRKRLRRERARRIALEYGGKEEDAGKKGKRRKKEGARRRGERTREREKEREGKQTHRSFGEVDEGYVLKDTLARTTLGYRWWIHM